LSFILTRSFIGQTTVLARPASNLTKILRRELKHDLDAGGCEMTPELSDLLKIVEKKMTIEVCLLYLPLLLYKTLKGIYLDFRKHLETQM